jgi:thioredoxin 1
MNFAGERGLIFLSENQPAAKSKGKKMQVMISLVLLIFLGCANNSEPKKETVQTSYTEKSDPVPLITFIELGSVNCIPCKMMQPVMESTGKRYGQQIKIIFYDVWKEDQRQFAVQYRIRLIPTQVFLNHRGREIMRHEGFFPEQEIDRFLRAQGLVPCTE